MHTVKGGNSFDESFKSGLNNLRLQDRGCSRLLHPAGGSGRSTRPALIRLCDVLLTVPDHLHMRRFLAVAMLIEVNISTGAVVGFFRRINVRKAIADGCTVCAFFFYAIQDDAGRIVGMDGHVVGVAAVLFGVLFQEGLGLTICVFS